MKIDTLAHYLGGEIIFVEEVVGPPKIAKGNILGVTPGVIDAFIRGKIPKGSARLLLRKLGDMTDEEAIAFSRVVAPTKADSSLVLSFDRNVYRQGKGNGETVEIVLVDNIVSSRSIVLNSRFDFAISQIFKPPNGEAPLIQQMAATNQVRAFAWLLAKKFDIYGLIAKNEAAHKK